MLTISLAPSGNLAVEIPSVLAEGRSHTVEIPLSINGLSLLKKILIDRQRERRPSIGMTASPCASQITSYLVEKERSDRAAAKEQSDAVLKKLNIILDL